MGEFALDARGPTGLGGEELAEGITMEVAAEAGIAGGNAEEADDGDSDAESP